MTATVRIGTCSWADEGLLKAWYPRGVSTAEKRLRYYAERFDTVEVDSPFYALPDPDVTARWAQRTPDDFTFHVKASAAMTWHEGEPTDDGVPRVPRLARAARAVRQAPRRPAPVPPALRRSRPRRRTSSRARPARLEPLVPLVEFRHRSWMEAGRAGGHARVPRASTGSRTSRVDSPPTRASNVMPRSPRRPTASPTSASTAATRRRGTSAAAVAADRFDWIYSTEELAEWVGPVRRLAEEADEVYALFNNNRDDFAPRSAAIFRGLLDEAGVPAAGGIDLRRPR